MDKIKFAELISFISMWAGKSLYGSEVAKIDELIGSGLPKLTLLQPGVASLVEEMFGAMALNRKIDAIKLHRQLTGYGLKESKDAIEKIMNRFIIQ